MRVLALLALVAGASAYSSGSSSASSATVPAGGKTVTITGSNGVGTFSFKTGFTVKACKDMVDADFPKKSGGISSWKSMLTSKCPKTCNFVPVFGTLVVNCVANSPGAPETDPTKPANGKSNTYDNEKWLLQMANSAAEMLDQDKDGYADDTMIEFRMRTQKNGHWVFAQPQGFTDEMEEPMTAIFGKAVAIKSYDFLGDPNGAPCPNLKQSLAASTEEIYHTFEHAYSAQYPKIFGTPKCNVDRRSESRRIGREISTEEWKAEWESKLFKVTDLKLKTRRIGSGCGADTSKCDWTSSKLTKCAATAMCDWYSGQLCCSKVGTGASIKDLTGGGCSKPDCAGTEWYYNLIFQWLNSGYTAPDGKWVTYFDGTVRGPCSHAKALMGQCGLGRLPGDNDFPNSTAAVEAQMSKTPECTDFFKDMKDPKYHQLSKPISYNYVVKTKNSDKDCPSTICAASGASMQQPWIFAAAAMAATATFLS